MYHIWKSSSSFFVLFFDIYQNMSVVASKTSKFNFFAFLRKKYTKIIKILSGKNKYFHILTLLQIKGVKLFKNLFLIRKSHFWLWRWFFWKKYSSYGKKLHFNFKGLHELGQFFSEGHNMCPSEKNCPSSCRSIELKCNFFPLDISIFTNLKKSAWN